MNGNELCSHFVHTRLERTLEADPTGTARNEIVHQLAEYATDLESKKRAGLAPLEYFQMERLLASVRVARQVVSRTWNDIHA